ncbi:DNA mismatch repair endonuclease MutL [Paenibacillus sp. HB172176]|uniref:DNA mismatch repair endonuclease MutL n=1 Tax=Paenibacillus sp. HB172176 TaxID=2493690 RepID=UPI001439C5C4|nr:DNA mismatch repair endonuclease MutL [Paenibacillus sp. HB172176]
MAGIKILDEQLANQIAAGEVVERPASVVKELVENAIDAGSSTIDVTIEEGGLSLIRVVDNGSGINGEELATAFQRHATSKIATSGDLFRIASLGFRGEALPSIAAVSRLICVSADGDNGLARKLTIEGGELVGNAPANAPQGTDMSVRDLFYNTPARLKYMKAIQTELGHISDYINRLALAHPGVSFTLRHNGNLLLRTQGTGDRLQVLAAIYGTNTAKAMLEVAASDPDYELTGYISKPELTRANRGGITIVVNGRYIRSHAVNQALLQAYHTLLPINRFPLAVIELEMHPGLLDVNVHPSKMEVRFSKEQELRAIIERAAKAALGKLRYIPGPDAGKKDARKGPQFVQDAISFHIADRLDSGKGTGGPIGGAHVGAAGSRQSLRQHASSTKSAEVPSDAAERLYKPNAASSRQQSSTEGSPFDSDMDPSWVAREKNGDWERPAENKTEVVEPTDQVREAAAAAETNSTSDLIHAEDAASNQKQRQEVGEPKSNTFPELHWIGQHHGTYIVAQAEDGLYLIDQHAAHERINYEYYLHKFGNPVAASQELLVPFTLEFTPGDAAQLREQLPLLREAGVELEPFGSQTFLVRSHPEWMPKGEEQSLLEEMAELIIQERKTIHIGKLREKAAIMCSCKASIKANDRISREEGDMLLSRLSRCEQPYTCPHGRPIIVHLSTYQLEKMFKRVMS